MLRKEKEKKRKKEKEKRKIKILNIAKVPFLLVHFLSCYIGFLDGSRVKNLPAMQETQQMGFDPWIREIL